MRDSFAYLAVRLSFVGRWKVLQHVPQFSVGFAMWSITRLGTDSCTALSLSPSCSCTAVKIEGQLSGSFADVRHSSQELDFSVFLLSLRG